MSEFSEIQKGSVEIQHYSTSSLIKLTITSQEPDRKGSIEETIQTIWLDYRQFSDLKNAIDLIVDGL